MNQINLFTASGLLIVIIYLPLIIFVLLRSKTKITILFCLHLLTVLIWGINCTIIGLTTDKDIALLFWRLTTIAVVFIPIFLFHVICLLSKQKSKILLFAYAQALFFASLALTDKLIPSTRLIFNHIHYKIGSPLYLIYFLLWLLIACIAHFKLIQYYKISYPHQKNQIWTLIWAIPLAFIGGATNFLPGLGFNIYPYGNLFVPIYGMMLAYSILKHELLDIVIVVKKSFVYSALITLISLLYLLVVFILEKFTQELFGYRSLIISVSTAFGLGLLFVPLRHRIQRFVDRYFFKGTSEEIALLNEQLRQEIAQSDKYKTLGTLASGIAHEVKNPLTAIKTFTEYLPRKLEDKNFLREFSRIVGKEVDRIDRLVHQLLHYAKPAPLTLKNMNINKLINETLDILSSKFIAQKITITKTLPPLPPDTPSSMSVGTPTKALAERRSCHLKIDPNQIRQALLNVLLNAVEAMPTGGSLTVKTRIKGAEDYRDKGNPSNPLILKSSNPIFEISIRDTGKGILPEDLQRIFDPFFTKKDSGTGLGLSIVQGIMENHGGKVRVESQAGAGTEVILELPITDEGYPGIRKSGTGTSGD